MQQCYPVIVIVGSLTWAASFGACTRAAPAPDIVKAEGGDITIVPLNHATLQIRYGSHVIAVDPVNGVDYGELPEADIVLVTDEHEDHFDRRGIERVRLFDAVVVAPPVVAWSYSGATWMKNGQLMDAKGVRVEAVPMYNTHGEIFHPKGRGNGYVVTIGGKRIYIAGDTACTDEMRALKNIDVAFLPMNIPWTMPPSEAAECAKAFRPAIVYPYHFRGSNPDDFKQALQGSAIEVRLRDWY